MKKIKNSGACVLDTVLGFLGSSDTQAPYSFSFLFSSFFLLLFLLSPSILVLSHLEFSLSLDFAQTQTQTHMPQAPFSKSMGLSLWHFFFVGFCAYGVVDLP